MTECNNSKIHISSNFLLSKSLIIMSDTLLHVPSLHCNTSQHFATLHQTTLHYTCRHFTSSHLNFTQRHFTTLIDTSLPLIYTSLPSHLAQPIYISYRSISPPITKLDTVLLKSQYSIWNDATQSTFQYFVAANGDDILDANFFKDEANFPLSCDVNSQSSRLRLASLMHLSSRRHHCIIKGSVHNARDQTGH
jgi:hypothetical protein